MSCTVTVAGVKVTLNSSEHTRTVVNGSGGTQAAISMVSRRDLRGCTFTTVFTDWSGRIGYGGFTKGTTRRQGTGTTPTGTYTVTEAFGLNGNPGTALTYRRAGADDWWILDFQQAPREIWNRFYHYDGSGYRPTEKSDNDTESERLTSFPGQYAYAAVLNFNRPGDPAGMNSTRGGGIFLHVNGSGATAGCVSTTRANMVKFLTAVRPGDRVTIVA